jgi:hypothetical protein
MSGDLTYDRALWTAILLSLAKQPACTNQSPGYYLRPVRVVRLQEPLALSLMGSRPRGITPTQNNFLAIRGRSLYIHRKRCANIN